MSEPVNKLICPFCMNSDVIAKPGKVKCPVCDATFEIDDQLECIFVDLYNVRLPLNGTVCLSCGLVQGIESKACLNCGMEITTAVH